MQEFSLGTKKSDGNREVSIFSGLSVKRGSIINKHKHTEFYMHSQVSIPNS